MTHLFRGRDWPTLQGSYWVQIRAHLQGEVINIGRELGFNWSGWGIPCPPTRHPSFSIRLRHRLKSIGGSSEFPWGLAGARVSLGPIWWTPDGVPVAPRWAPQGDKRGYQKRLKNKGKLTGTHGNTDRNSHEDSYENTHRSNLYLARGNTHRNNS